MSPGIGRGDSVPVGAPDLWTWPVSTERPGSSGLMPQPRPCRERTTRPSALQRGEVGANSPGQELESVRRDNKVVEVAPDLHSNLRGRGPVGPSEPSFNA